MDIIERFEERASTDPEATALVAAQERMTYRELDSRADRLAHLLQRRGAGPETVVGLCMDRRPEAFVAMLAVLKTGGAVLPMDPGHPARRLRDNLAACGALLLLTERAHTEAFQGLDIPVLPCEEFADAAAEYPATRPDRFLHEAALRCVLFTSGSTGRPKGIGLPSASIRKVAEWAVHRLDGPQVFLQFTSLGFDVSLQEIFGALLSGGSLVLVREEHRQDPAALLDLMVRERVERIYLSPAFLRQFARAALQDRDRMRALVLTEIVSAGEPLRLTPEVREFMGALPGTVLENQYGPSETHQATACTLDGGLASWPDAPPLGRPLPGVRGHVLDERLAPVADGRPGELYLTGVGVSRGYLGRPELTAARFLPDPHGAPGGRMYRTGDLVRRRSTGELEFVGRSDGQVKVRGHRVEPAEVDAVFTAHPQVREAATVAHQAGDGTWVLTSYLVPRPGAVLPAAAELRSFAGRRLPGYMVPGALMSLEELPLNRNGKVDRAALPRPDAAWRDGSTEYVPARNPQQVLIRDIWAQALERDPGHIGIDDAFLDLGGNSLRAMQVLARVRQVFDVDLSVRVLFDSPTVRRLAQAVEEAIIADLSTAPAADS
ncbi:non-ribosomal peptide synthetase [Streptomyces sp. BE147]|uniref:non-ribosomal peptide synthetase n=1 Tax=unclassified Streptomyces TaxID=2593676 RepID=UPI002E775924|nr:non-ribosomal peptide synthetase [Streptomyces sp. BE147]MEE1740445.1 non-ribosomal peptide synthetase [Streptomyces sp. BE147]